MTSAPKDNLSRLVDQTAERFAERFGRPPSWVVAAPGRVNLIGEHTDYNGGFVFPLAIDRYVVMAADRPRERRCDKGGDTLHTYSETLDEWLTIPVDGSTGPVEGCWSNYLRGVVVGCRSRGLELGSLDLLIDSTVPLGSGLSSSAALEVATATLVEAVTGQSLDKLEKAELCQKAEHEYAGVPCGIMDQFSSVMGERDRLMLLDCRSNQAEMVPFADPAVMLLVVNSNVEHRLVSGEYAKRRAECERASEVLGIPQLREATLSDLDAAGDRLEEVFLRRARHVISENERTCQAAEAIRREDWKAAGELMVASHASLRDDYEVSCKELDLLVDIAMSIAPGGGVYGSRMTGGGFGGCTVSLIRADREEAITERIQQEYFEKTGIQPTIFTTRPAQGAQVAIAPSEMRPNMHVKPGRSVKSMRN